MVDTLFNGAPRVAESFSEDERFVAVCDDALSFARKLPGDFFALIITSPPYNIGKEYEKRSSLRDYLGQQKPLIAELVRTLKPTGSLCWQVGNFVDDGEVFPLDVFYYDQIGRAHV
jgi:DNA modification methylase